MECDKRQGTIIQCCINFRAILSMRYNPIWFTTKIAFPVLHECYVFII